MFGCLCFPLFPSPTIHKLQERSTPCVYLGPTLNHRGFKCYDMSNGKIIICRHVKFIETEFPFSKLHKPQVDAYKFLDFNPILNHLHHQNSAIFLPTNITPRSGPQPSNPQHIGTIP